jgi:hypothetical protein
VLGRFSAKWTENWRRWRRRHEIGGEGEDGRPQTVGLRAYIALTVVALVLLLATLDRVATHGFGALLAGKRLPLSSETSAAHAKALDVATSAAPSMPFPLSPGAASFARWMENHVVAEPPEVAANENKGTRANAPTSAELKWLEKATGWEFFYPAWGRFDHHGNYVESPSPEKFADLGIDLEDLVDDPDRRVERDFRTPGWLRPRVLFWLGVHTAFSTRMRVIHDRRDPSILYGYLDLRTVYRMTGRTELGDTWAYRIDAKVKKLLRKRLAEAGGLTKKGSSGMSDREREAIQAFLSGHGMASREDVARALWNVRSQTGQRDEFLAALRRSRNLLPHIEATLRRYDMPIALGRIPFVESSFNARAYSKVGAVGIWQFMPATARQFISASDRKLWVDPLRQTAAAARMLRIFRSQLPDWSTTVTAYNSGAGRLSRLVRKFRADSLEGILSVKGNNGLGFAGENFYAQFVSANLVEAYRHEVFHKYLDSSEMAITGGRRSRLPIDRLRCEY